ncbi:MFS transporter [Paenibacillus sp. TY11]|uniref:MFS transporter n=1 Tax=Paenibacillus sp. TY11 TaxID=3448633 RepID=UPI00403919EC
MLVYTVRLYKGMGLFLAGSALCGLSQDMTQLIILRAIQGIGVGALIPIGMTIIGDLFPPERSGKMQGLFGAIHTFRYSRKPLSGLRRSVDYKAQLPYHRRHLDGDHDRRLLFHVADDGGHGGVGAYSVYDHRRHRHGRLHDR